MTHGTRPPFPPGNALALTSGHRAPRVYGELARALTEGLLDERPDLERFPEAVAHWATVEAQSSLLRRRLDEVGPLDASNEPREGLLKWFRLLEASALKARAVLGLDPAAEARLTRDRAAAAALAAPDLEAFAARGRAIVAAREAAGIEPPRDLAAEVLDRVRAAAPATPTHHQERNES